MTLDEIVKHPKISLLTIRPRHGTSLIVAEAFWDGTVSMITGVGPTAEDAVRSLAAEIRTRTGAAPTLPTLPELPVAAPVLPELPVAAPVLPEQPVAAPVLPELPVAAPALPTIPTLPEIPR